MQNLDGTRIETCGEILQKCMIELVRKPFPSAGFNLLIWDGTATNIQPHVRLRPKGKAKFQPRVFVPPSVDPSVQKAVSIPTHAASYKSTETLFRQIRALIEKYSGLDEKWAVLITHAILSSWLVDLAPRPISLSLLGPESVQKSQLFRLLACLYRKPLMLTDVTVADLTHLPENFCPSLFIERYGDASQLDKLLRATSSRDCYVLSKGRVVRLNCPKVICTEESLEPRLGNLAIEIPIDDSDGALPRLDNSLREQITNEFQPKLLMYRIRNYRRASESTFDVADFTAPVRELARCLAATVADEPSLQKDLVVLLEEHNEQVRSELALNVDAIVVETLLGICHQDLQAESVHVGAVSEGVNRVLERRGEILRMQPRGVANRMRQLQLIPRRIDAAGRGLLLVDAVRRRIHNLAKKHQISETQKGCPHCQELLRTK